MKDQLTMQIRNDLSELSGVYESVEKFGTGNEISPEALYKIQLSVEEILTNVISYAFQDELEHRIDVWLGIDDELVYIRISDDGVAFDPTEVVAPELDDDLQNRQIGGLGIFLVQGMMKSVSYSREAGKNILQMEIEKDLTD